MRPIVIVDGSIFQNVVAAAVIKTKYPEAVMHDLALLNIAGVSGVVAGIGDGSADAVIVLALPVAVAADYKITDAQIVTLANKISADAVAPYDAVIVISAAVEGVNQAALAFAQEYDGKMSPKLIAFLSGNLFPVDGATATSNNATTITKAGQFTGKNHVGKYVYIVSATKGTYEGQVREITEHTDNALTFAAMSPVPSGTVVFGICDNIEEANAPKYLNLAAMALGMVKVLDTDFLQKWAPLIDWGVVETRYQVASYTATSTTTNIALLKEILELGKKIERYLSFA